MRLAGERCPQCGEIIPIERIASTASPVGKGSQAIPPTPSRPATRGSKILAWSLIGLVGVLMVAAGTKQESRSASFSAPSSSSTSHGCVTAASGPEDALAVVEEGTACPSELGRVRFRTLLAQLSPRCGESDRRVADIILNTHQILKDKGIKVRPVEITEELDRSVRTLRVGQGDNACPKLLALYSIFRENQGVTGR
jgi:hypothetical protein